MITDYYKLKEDYENLDKHLELIPITFDAMFKSVFLKNKDILKKFIISLLEEELDPNECKIEILNNELVKDRFNERKKVIDIYVLLSGYVYVNLEINRSYYNDVMQRNQMYESKKYSTLLDENEDARELRNKRFVQINLNVKEKDIDFGEDKIVSYGLTSGKIYFENKYTLVKYLDYYRNLYYNEFENLTEGDIWLAALTSKSFTELNNILENLLEPKERFKFIEDVIQMCRNKHNLTRWQRARLEEIAEYDTRMNAIEEGHAIGLAKGLEQGLEQGIERGIEQGEKNSKFEIAKKMLDKNFDISVISEITGLDKNEILTSVNKNKE